MPGYAPAILLVDDDQRQLELLTEVFTDHAYRVTACSGGDEALVMLDDGGFDTVVTDLKMPGLDGTTVLEAARRGDPELPVIVITGYGTVDSAIAAMKIGAYDYIEKPFDPEELVYVVARAVEHYRLVRTNRELAAEVASLRPEELIGDSAPMRQVKDMIQRLASLDVPVLISGETGTGKELVARLLHRASTRAKGRFLAVNCAAFSEPLLESELFGHEKGAFTGAVSTKKGIFEAAAGGTLFLDEVNSMSPALQARLLRVLQEGVFLRVGGTREIATDIRLLGATNADLKAEVEAGRFRDDLYYRLNVMTIELPPLRKRGDDIPRLAYHFLRRFAGEYGKEVTAIDSGAVARLMAHSWPGNVRELENVVGRAVIMAAGPTLTAGDLSAVLDADAPAATDLPLMPLAEMERLMIKKALHVTGGNRSRAAALLGIDASTLWRKMKRWQLS